MKRLFSLVLLVMAIPITGVRGETDVRALIGKASPEHPRLFLARGAEDALRDRILLDPALKKALEHVIAVADGVRDVEPVKREKTGKRLLTISRTCLKRVNYLALAYRLTGNKRYAARAQKEMLAAAAFSDWNPSHFLDVGEMTAALAIGYDWIYDDLDPEARRLIKTAIIEKGLKTSLKGGGWVKTRNNWNQVCHGGLTIGALAVLEDESDLASKIIERAIANVPRAMAEYAPDGAYPEGPGYWKYGTTYNVLLIAALESVLGTDFGLSKSKGFLESSDYYQQATGPAGLFFNYSDCGSSGGVSSAMFWFAARRAKASLLWREKQALKEIVSGKPDAKSSSGRMFPFILVWAESLDNVPGPETRHWKADGVTPVAMHRSGWKTREETYVGVKAGSPGANHAHMDIGSFVMDAGGVRWAIDLGSQSYYSLESKGINLWGKKQDSQRWEVFRLSNLSHNTLVVDGQKQRVAGFAPIIGFSDKGPMPHTIVDMTPVYKDQLAKAKRGIGLHQDGSVLVRDEFETLDRETKVRWGMVTRAEIDLDGRRAVLRQGDRQLVLTVLAPENVRLETYETAKPPNAYDVSNKGTRMIGFQTTCSPAAKSAFLVQLRLGEAVSDLSEARALAEW